MTEAERIMKMREIRIKFLAHDLTGSASAGIELLEEWAKLCGHVTILRTLPNFERFINDSDLAGREGYD